MMNVKTFKWIGKPEEKITCQNLTDQSHFGQN
jgi:hypothetical protein